MTPFRSIALAATLALTPLGGIAATLHEASAGGFSGDWAAPTAVAAGVTRIEGTGAQNQPDFLLFSGLAAGAQSFGFLFSGPETPGWSYSAGGQVLYSDQPFRWGWDGASAFSFNLDHYTPSATATLTLGDGFKGGDLYLALYFTHGRLDYALDARSNAVALAASGPAPVPLPPAALLLVGALAALGVVRRRRA